MDEGPLNRDPDDPDEDRWFEFEAGAESGSCITQRVASAATSSPPTTQIRVLLSSCEGTQQS